MEKQKRYRNYVVNDELIKKHLETNPTLSINKLSVLTGLHKNTVWKHLKQIEK